jgi:hypothetical protein
MSLSACLILSGLATPSPDADEYTRRDLNVGRVIMALIGSEIVDRDPGPALLRDITTRCEGDDIYCYEAQPSYAFEGRNIQYDWTAKIEFNQPYTSFRDVPIPESWIASKAGVDQGTDGHIFYQESRTGPTPQGRVVIKKLKSGVMMTLTETRPTLEPKQSLIDRALERWRIFDSAAQKYALFDASPLEVICRGGDMEDQSLQDGDVVYLVTHQSQNTILPLEIKATPGLVPTGRTAKILFTIREVNNCGPCFVLTQNGRELDVYGAEGLPEEITYQLETTSGNEFINLEITPESVELLKWNIPPEDMEESLRNELIYAAIINNLEISLEGHRINFFIQASPWELVITRFWVTQIASESRRIADESSRQGVTYPEIPDMTGREFVFYDYVEHLAMLWNEFNGGLYPHVVPRPGESYGPEEKVYIGWAKNEDTGHTFHVCTDDPERRTQKIPAYQAQAGMFAEFDLEILLDPKARTYLDQGSGEWMIDRDVRFNDWDRQKEIWRDFQMQDLLITLHEVDPVSGTIRGPAPEADFLRGPISSLRNGTRLDLYANNKLPDVMRRILIYDLTAQPYPFGPLHIGGFFEVRLSLDVARLNDATNHRNADVAIRFKTSRGEFESGVIEFHTQRESVPLKKKRTIR